MCTAARHLTCAYCHLPARLALFGPAQCHSSVLQVKSVTIFRDPRTGISKGCGLVAMASHAEAEAALAALDQKLQVEVLACLEAACTQSADRPGWQPQENVSGPSDMHTERCRQQASLSTPAMHPRSVADLWCITPRRLALRAAPRVQHVAPCSLD